MYVQQGSNPMVCQQQVQHQQWSGVTQNMVQSVQGVRDARIPQAFTSQSLANLQNMQIPSNINSPYEVFQPPSASVASEQFHQNHQVFHNGENVFVQSYQCADVKPEQEYQYESCEAKAHNEYQIRQQNLQLYGQYQNQYQNQVEQVQPEVSYPAPSDQISSQYQFLIPRNNPQFSEPTTSQNVQFSNESLQNFGDQSVSPQKTVHQQAMNNTSLSVVNQEVHQQQHPQYVTNSSHQESFSQSIPSHPVHQMGHQQFISSGHVSNHQHQTVQIPHGQVSSHSHVITANVAHPQMINSATENPVPQSNQHIVQSLPQMIHNNPGQQLLTTPESANSSHQSVISNASGQPQLLTGGSGQTQYFTGGASHPQLLNANCVQTQPLGAGNGQQQFIMSNSQPHIISSANSSQGPFCAPGTILVPVQQQGQAQLPQMISTGNGQFIIIQPNMFGQQLVQNQPALQTTQLLIQTPQGLVVQPIFTLPQSNNMAQFMTVPSQQMQPQHNNAAQQIIRIVQSAPLQQSTPPTPLPSTPQCLPLPSLPVSQLGEEVNEGKESMTNLEDEVQIMGETGSLKDDTEEGCTQDDDREEEPSEPEEVKPKMEENESKEETIKFVQPSTTQPVTIQMLPRNMPQQIFINGSLRSVMTGNPSTPMPGQVLPVTQPDGTTQPFMVVAQNPAVQQMMMAPPPSQSPDSTEDAGQPTINQTNAHIVDGVDLEEIKEFAKAFKMRRLSLGLTQTQIGQALSATAGPAYSQSAICRFERLDITPKSAQKIRPVLERWMKEAEEKFKQGQRELVEFVRLPGLNKIRKRRTSFSPDAVGLLSQYFEINKHPTGSEVTRLAQQLGYEREVVRIWFCNRRQAMRNAAKFVGRGKNKQVTIPERSSEAANSPDNDMEDEVPEMGEDDVEDEDELKPESTTVQDENGDDESLVMDIEEQEGCR